MLKLVKPNACINDFKITCTKVKYEQATNYLNQPSVSVTVVKLNP